MLIALTTVSGLFAKTTQTLLINGEQVNKVVSSISFDGDNVVLHFGNDTESYDMNLVSIALDYNAGLENLNVYTFNSKIEGGVISVTGLDADTPIFLYNLNGVIAASAKSDYNGNASIDIESLQGGVYIMRAGNNCVKFVKR